MNESPSLSDHDSQLDDFNPGLRQAALRRAATRLPAGDKTSAETVNMHVHSFFSYNADGWSPSRIAWEAKRRGWYAAGLCDFDVLDGLEEFLAAGRLLALRTGVFLETRAYLAERADVDLSSPGEPGVTYIMGAGFGREPGPGTDQARGLDMLRERARRRNLDVIGRINERLPEIALDYDRDVVPVTPKGVATERHIVRAYVDRAAEALGPGRAAGFWGGLFKIAPADAERLTADRAAFEEKVRGALLKRGGIGYRQPSPETFPGVDAFVQWVLSCEAVPMIAWLDGSSAGERDPRAYLECLCTKGIAAVNVIPDRNWNVSDPNTRAARIAALNAFVAAAEALKLPINIGTEMNRAGLPPADDLAVDALRPHAVAFRRGARVMVGQSVLSRYAAFSYVGAAARAEFPDPAKRTAFFESVGAMPPLDEPTAARLEELGPERAYGCICDGLRAGGSLKA